MSFTYACKVCVYACVRCLQNLRKRFMLTFTTRVIMYLTKKKETASFWFCNKFRCSQHCFSLLRRRYLLPPIDARMFVGELLWHECKSMDELAESQTDQVIPALAEKLKHLWLTRISAFESLLPRVSRSDHSELGHTCQFVQCNQLPISCLSEELRQFDKTVDFCILSDPT